MIWFMNWLVASLIMFVSSIVFYLSVKKLQVLGVDKRVYTLANNLVPVFLFAILAYRQGVSLWLTLGIILTIFLMRVGFNYLGTLAGYKGMELAPNAGYSLVIQKSYGVFTLFASVLLFGSELPIGKVLLSLFIIACAVYVGTEGEKKKKRSGGKWFGYSLLAMFSFGAISLSSKYFAIIGVEALAQLFWTILLTLAVTSADMRRLRGKIDLRLSKESYLYMLVLGVSVSVFYYFKLMAEITAPNIGYVGAINAASNAFYTVIVAKLFKDALNWKTMLAVLGITGGLIGFWFV